MPKKKLSPVIRCLDFFREAELAEARLTLIIAIDILQRRMLEAGVLPKKAVKKKDRRQEPPTLAAVDGTKP